jgi:CMP-N-acetylneuraminate monooxygenase
VESQWINSGINRHDLQINTITPIKFENKTIAFLHKDKNGLVTAYKNKCSHMGDPLQVREKRLVCPTHGWSYTFNGVNENSNELGLRTIEINFDQNFVLVRDPRKKPRAKLESRTPPTLKVHSHACLELTWKNFTIITDPWVTGEAYWGSWKLWPPPLVLAENLNADVIVITHPHPDHFHLETLKHLNRETPIYFPRFMSNIIDTKLKALGFRNALPCNFSEKMELQPGLSLEFFKPTSSSEDSIVLFGFDDFYVLNQNDAGAVFDDESIPSAVDVLACAFDQGASGYPLTWNNLSDQRKLSILKHEKEFKLKRIANLCNRYQASYFLPFAGHWRLNLKAHAKYATMISHTSFNEIDDILKQNTNTQLLDVYPGEFYDFMLPVSPVNSQRSIIKESVFAPVAEIPDFKKLSSFDVKSLDAKFQELKALKKVFSIESVLFKIQIDDSYFFSVDLRDSDSLDYILVEVEIPEYIGRIICDEGLNWDHIAIGYWGKWSRNTTFYPSNFMRALQTSTDFLRIYPAREFIETNEDKVLDLNIASLIEEHSELVLRILNQAGLPCVGCFYSPTETLRTAINRHRLPIGTQSRLVKELKELINL